MFSILVIILVLFSCDETCLSLFRMSCAGVFAKLRFKSTFLLQFVHRGVALSNEPQVTAIGFDIAVTFNAEDITD